MSLPPPCPALNASQGWACHWLGTNARPSWKITQERNVTQVPASSKGLKSGSSRIIWTRPSLPHLVLAKDSPVNFKVWLANTQSHPLDLWMWSMGVSLSLLCLPGCVLCTRIKPYRSLRKCPTFWAWSSISSCPATLFLTRPIGFSIFPPATSFLTQTPWLPKPCFSSSHVSSVFQLWGPRLFCSLYLVCCSLTSSPGCLLLDIQQTLTVPPNYRSINSLLGLSSPGCISLPRPRSSLLPSSSPLSQFQFRGSWDLDFLFTMVSLAPDTVPRAQKASLLTCVRWINKYRNTHHLPYI